MEARDHDAPRQGQCRQLGDVADLSLMSNQQDLVDAMLQTGKPVMIKRGLSATVEEWLLAAE